LEDAQYAWHDPGIGDLIATIVHPTSASFKIQKYDEITNSEIFKEPMVSKNNVSPFFHCFKVYGKRLQFHVDMCTFLDHFPRDKK
jgi:hypothetical protein